MTQLLAACLIVIFGFGILVLVAMGATKPYDNGDYAGAFIALGMIALGLGRIGWIAFQ